jgi:hypothetical protein
MRRLSVPVLKRLQEAEAIDADAISDLQNKGAGTDGVQNINKEATSKLLRADKFSGVVINAPSEPSPEMIV